MEENITVLELLQLSKKFYTTAIEKDIHYGMCYCIKESLSMLIAERITDSKKRSDVLNNMCLSNRVPIIRYIPEFNPTFTEAHMKKIDSGAYVAYDSYWWHLHDSYSRVYAFDKLISVYEHSNKTIL